MAEIATRAAGPADAAEVAADIVEGFAGYRSWAPPGWAPPHDGPALEQTLRERLADEDVWCLLALSGGRVAGHVALAARTAEDPVPAPPGTVNLWQLFVRRPLHGRGVATLLMELAVAEAARRGHSRMRLWTPRDAGRARRFYEREGWTATGRVHELSPSGLVTVEYGRELPAGAGLR